MPRVIKRDDIRGKFAKYADGTRVFDKPKEPEAPKPDTQAPVKSESDLLLRLITQQLANLTKATTAGFTGMLEAEKKEEVKGVKVEAWEFDIIRDADNRIQKIKATKK